MPAGGSARARGQDAAPRGATRRSVLAASLAGGIAASLSAAPAAVPLLAVAGCGAPADATPATGREPDVAILRAAISAKQQMATYYTAVRAVHPELARRLDPLLRDHAAHLAELQRRLIEPGRHTAAPASQPGTPAGGQPGTQAGGPQGSAAPGPPVPATRNAAVAALRLAERAAAAAHVAQLRAVTPSLAQLLASIAACEAAHVAALSRRGLSP